MSRVTRHRRISQGFSLIELVVVVVIIGIIAAIAIPKMSKGAQGAADSALTGDLKELRQAIDMYVNEHGGSYPDAAKIADQLTKFSNADGSMTSANKDTGTNQIVFGPYLRSIPPAPVGSLKGQSTIGLSTATPSPAWNYDPTSGAVTANATGNDAAGNAYSSY
jgi:prepilin-type N-terminal cleavage/methylation domain-containing protein